MVSEASLNHGFLCVRQFMYRIIWFLASFSPNCFFFSIYWHPILPWGHQEEDTINKEKEREQKPKRWFHELLSVGGKFTDHPVSETDIRSRTVAQHEFCFTLLGNIFKYSLVANYMDIVKLWKSDLTYPWHLISPPKDLVLALKTFLVTLSLQVIDKLYTQIGKVLRLL